MSNPDGARQWHEMTQHLVRAHGGYADGLIGYAPTLEELLFAHADTHLALALISAEPPDGHTHPSPLDPGLWYRRVGSYHPFWPSASVVADHFWSGQIGFPLPHQTGLPHTGAHCVSDADLACWAAGRLPPRLTRREADAADWARTVELHPELFAAATRPDWIKASAARAAAAWQAGITFASRPQTRRPILPARRGAGRAGRNISYPARGRGR